MNRWLDCSPGIFEDLINFWEESIKNKMAATAIQKKIDTGQGQLKNLTNEFFYTIISYI